MINYPYSENDHKWFVISFVIIILDIVSLKTIYKKRKKYERRTKAVFKNTKLIISRDPVSNTKNFFFTVDEAPCK
jgi:hypothetical protein